MPKHRHPHPNVSDKEPGHNLDDFDPGRALEELHVDMQRIGALAEAATSAMEFMPRASTPEERRANGRIYALVSLLADEIAAALTTADAMVVRLGEYMQARRRANAVRR